MTALSRRHCSPLPAGTPPLAAAEIKRLLVDVPGWRHSKGALRATFAFKDYHRTMAFVNAVAWIAHEEDHHPGLVVSYNRCGIAFNTHSIGGISLNDFICAAKINTLLRTTHAQPSKPARAR
jgi:4a-hydroxytetrahydrobiopterin dehydratase